MTTAVEVTPPPVTQQSLSPRAADVLVIGGCLIAPLNLLIVRSLTAYDVVIFAAFALLVCERRLTWAPRRYTAAAYVFMLAALLSSFRAMYPTEALTQVLQYLFVFFVQIPAVLTVVRSRRRAVICVALLCAGTLGAILHAHLFPQTQGAGRSLVFYSDNPNRLGYPAVYLLPLLLALWHLSRGRRRMTRTLVFVTCAASVYLAAWAVAASGSRSSLVGCAAALLVFLVLRPDVGLIRAAGRAVALVAVVVALVFGLVSTGNVPSTLQERVNRSIDPEDRGDLVGDREHLVIAGTRAFVEMPYLGTGLDNFRYVTVNYDADATPQLPHNLWLQLLVQVGVFGTLAFATLLVFWIRDIVHTVRRAADPDRELLWAIAASLAGILAIFLFAPEMLDRHYWLIFALGLAGTVGTQYPNHLGGTK